MAISTTYYARGRWWTIKLPYDVIESGCIDAYCEEEMDRQLQRERNLRMINNPTWWDKLQARFYRKQKSKE